MDFVTDCCAFKAAIKFTLDSMKFIHVCRNNLSAIQRGGTKCDVQTLKLFGEAAAAAAASATLRNDFSSKAFVVAYNWWI